MKWINGYSREYKKMLKRDKIDEAHEKLRNWHKWFAWYPVVVGHTPEHRQIKVWWQYVARSIHFSILYSCGNTYYIATGRRYREIEDNTV